MEYVFSNKGDYTNANILSARDNTVLYTVATMYGKYGGCKTTTLINPSTQEHVGVIDWVVGTFRILGRTMKWDTLHISSGGFAFLYV
jgi:hypothetical protein